MPVTQKVSTSARNINLYVDTDDPDFELLINGKKYETHPQNYKRISNGTRSNRSIRTTGKVQNSNALQRAIRDRMYKTAEGVSYY